MFIQAHRLAQNAPIRTVVKRRGREASFELSFAFLSSNEMSAITKIGSHFRIVVILMASAFVGYYHMKTRVALIAVLIASAAFVGTGDGAFAKEWTINERQDQLMKDINAAQKKKELTDKEAKKLRGDLADVARKEAKLRGKNNKQIPVEDLAKLEKALNGVSVAIKELALEKRVDVAKDKANAAEEKADAKKDAAKEAKKKSK